MMEEYPTSLSKMYSVDDNLMEVFYLQNGKAAIYSMTSKPKVINF